MKNKKAVGNGVLVFGGLFVVVLLLLFVGLPMMGINVFSMAGTGEGGVFGCDPNCNVAPSVVWTAQEQYSKSTSDTTANAVSLYSEGVLKTATPLTALTTLTPCKKIKYYGYVDSTSYYGQKETSLDVVCGNQEAVVKYWTIATYSSLSNYAKNNDGTTNSATATQSFSAGDVETMTISWTGQYEKVAGHPDCGNVLVVDLVNATKIDDVTSTDMTKTTVPEQVSVEANHKYYAFKFPAIMSSEEIQRHLNFDIDDTYGYGTDNITITLYDCQQYHDGNDDTIKFGVEDEASADVGMSTHDTLTIYTS